MELAPPASALRSRLATVPLETVAPLVITGWVALNYAWTCRFGFINDDYVWVEQAVASVRGLGLPRVPITAYLRPMIGVSFTALVGPLIGPLVGARMAEARRARVTKARCARVAKARCARVAVTAHAVTVPIMSVTAATPWRRHQRVMPSTMRTAARGS